jgi:hypothetical protein
MACQSTDNLSRTITPTPPAKPQLLMVFMANSSKN